MKMYEQIWNSQYLYLLISRSSAPQLGNLIALEMVFLQNYDNLLVAMLLFQIDITCGISKKIFSGLYGTALKI